MESKQGKNTILKKRKQQVDQQNKVGNQNEKIDKKIVKNDGNTKNIQKQTTNDTKNNKKNKKQQEQEEDKLEGNDLQGSKKEEKKEKVIKKWTYEGEKNEEGQFHGKGVYVFRSGSKYDGEFVNGKRNGYGVLQWDNYKERYEGYWKDNKRHGQGKFWHANGDIYEGEFDQEKMHGKGKYTHTCGDIYEGQYVDDKMEAYGTYTWADGTKYVGIRVENKREGEGTMFYNNGMNFKAIWHFNEVKEILKINDPNPKHKIKPLKEENYDLITESLFGINDEQEQVENKQKQNKDFIKNKSEKQQLEDLQKQIEEEKQQKQKQIKCGLCIIRYKKKALVKQLPCGCKLHGHCADIWLKSDQRCPICRKKIKDNNKNEED